MPREPWVKLKIGIRRSGKIAGLPTDTARLGWIYTLVEAKVQRRMGVFDNQAHFVEVLGRFGKYFDAYRAAGLLHVAPDLCAECKPRHRDARRGEVVVHDYLREQRDPTNADRQAEYRASHSDQPEGDADVTATVTPTVTDVSGATVTADSRARATTATATGTRENERVPLKPKTRGRNGAGPTLSKTELAAWSTFGREWDGFRGAWIGRGLRLPPAGDPEGDDASQRGLLWQILDARPTDVLRWVAEAPTKPGTSQAVVAHVLEQWHAVRVDAGDDDASAWMTPGPDRRGAAEAVGAILARVAKGDG